MKKVLIILMLILINNAALAQNIENEEYTAENIINFISRMDIEDVDDAMYFLREYTHNAYNNDNYTAGKYIVKEIKSDEELADIGFKYADDNKSRLACSDAFINGDIKSRLFNKPMDNILILNSQLEKSIKVLENYLAEKEENARKAEEQAKIDAEAKAKAERLANPTTEDLLKDIKALLEKQAQKE